MREYRMVIHTFCYPETASPKTCGGTVWLSAPFINQGANEPVDAQRLTSSSAPFVIQGQRVMWQAEIPYGRLHLLSIEANEFDGIRMMLFVQL